MVVGNNLNQAYFFQRFTNGKMQLVVTLAAGLILFNILFAVTQINLPEILGFEYKIIKKSQDSDSSVIHRDVKLVNPISKRCSSRGSRLLIMSSGGLGNLMFQYASTSTIARRLGMQFVLPTNSKLLSVFKLKLDNVGNSRARHSTAIRESHGCAFDPTLFDIPCEHEVRLCCYLQSWKYFEGFESEIRSQFVFTSQVENLAQFYWHTVILPAAKQRGERVTYIAVHVRRGDKATNPKFIASGNTIATKEYLLNGYEFFRKKFVLMDKGGSPNSTNRSNDTSSFSSRSSDLRNRNVLFVVCSDDLPWARKVLPQESSVFVDTGVAEVDMAVLSKCNHTLMTVGTFGWWVSWLVDGVTVYYKHMFKPGSFLAKQFNNSLVDWASPSWIPME